LQHAVAQGQAIGIDKGLKLGVVDIGNAAVVGGKRRSAAALTDAVASSVASSFAAASTSAGGAHSRASDAAAMLGALSAQGLDASQVRGECGSMKV
jgi:hypothetical protein